MSTYGKKFKKAYTKVTEEEKQLGIIFCIVCEKKLSTENSRYHHLRKQHGILEGSFGCPWCKSKSSSAGHVVWCKDNPNVESTRQKISESVQNRDEQYREGLSQRAKLQGFGGHTSKRKLYFKKNNGEVVYLQSSYEIEFATILEDLRVDWERPNPLQWIDKEGKDHRYYPDFKVGSLYLDTKNDYLARIDAKKIELVKEQNNIDLRIVTKEQINKKWVMEQLR